MKRIRLSLTVLLGLSLVLSGCSATSSSGVSATAITQQPVAQAPQTPQVDVVREAAEAYFAKMPADVYKIPEKDFVAKVKAGEDLFIMDVRQAKDYDAGHIKGAVNIPWGEAIAQNLVNLPKDKTIMVYCYTGQTAGQTVALLNVAGFNAKSVNLGWNLGISKVEGVADVTETTANVIPAGKAEIKPEVQTAITEYFSKMAELKGTTYANYKISEDDAKKALDAKDPNVMFLSLRKADDFNKGHIEGAINLPFAKGMQAYFGMLLPQDKKIVAYCYTGQTAGQTVAILRLLGYDAVSLNSGMGMPSTPGSGWANKGFPVVGIENAAPPQGSSGSQPSGAQPQPNAGDHS
ncbi:rhodanese-related sulfurtransferase [Desulfitobacterium dichloroeliminans LMG P-21439]|uniref:Rhodanese-related sulfurtransferase n=1 Tax=Desulfitobacterium dichloroeliminans (strain LMG P-21439 / DCA1) TaxID=871963 RepID=L0FCJ0_DESDL|nr:rhodanese-like domain-containing protein [Desulfitobacterium dichloroeliminans]AGA70376.1 rhodanese-related sulfurtransferase [Desulfitobacterium dichloroeliminans LMG P-21439]